MFFFGDPTVNRAIRSRRHAIISGAASVFDIAGDVTSPYTVIVPRDCDTIVQEFRNDRDKVLGDYSKAVKKVVKQNKA